MKISLTKIIALALCLMMVLGVVVACTPKETVEPTPAPTLTPEPPKVILPDVPADRYDASVTPRTGANANTPFVVSSGNFDGKFSPFFATSAYDVDASDWTQIGLLALDKAGAPQAGIEWPSYAYSFSQEVSADNSTSTYKFILKNGITFSDGEPVSVKDLLFSIYTLCDPLYDGASTFYSLNVQGLNEYRLQTSAEVVAEIDAILEAGFTLNESGQIVPNAVSGVAADKQAAFWATLPETGAAFTQEIIDYVVASYGNDEEAAGLDESFTWATFDTPSKQAAYAMAMWNLGSLTADMQFEDAGGKVWDLKTQEITALDCWNGIITAYEFDVEAAQAETAGSVVLKDAIVTAYAQAHSAEGGVPSISGITYGTETSADGVDREYIQIVMNGVDPTAIFKLGVAVAPMHYYTEGYTGELNEFGVALNDPAFIQVLKDKNVKPVGAGPYIFQEFKDNVITYTANDSFLLGSPKIATFRLQAIEMGAELDAALTGTVHYTDPSASALIINDITAAQGDYAKLAYTLVDNDGYGYIGINARFFPEWQVRKAIAHAMNVQLTVDDWYGELATVNYRTMTKIQWAYPENPQNLFPYDATGETSKALFLEAGYIYDAAANIMYYPEGHEKAGQQFTIKATIPSADITKHPAAVVLIDTQKVLASIGVKLDIEPDTALLSKLNTAYDSGIQMWAAAWGSGGADPDLFQVWCSDPAKNQSTSPTAKGLYWLYDNGSEDQKAMLRQLNDLIVAGRSTLDVEERKVIYAQALELTTGTATEIPTYQRKNMYVFDKNVVNADTLFSGENVTPFQSPIKYIWNVELVG